jgi:hypothetical protein
MCELALCHRINYSRLSNTLLFNISGVGIRMRYASGSGSRMPENRELHNRDDAHYIDGIITASWVWFLGRLAEQY